MQCDKKNDNKVPLAERHQIGVSDLFFVFLPFAISTEPLATALHQSGILKGINRNGIEHKTSLYVDDVLLHVSNPDSSVAHVILILE